MPVQQQQRRPDTGLQVLGVHPIHGDPTIVDGELVLVLGRGRTDDAVDVTDMKPPGARGLVLGCVTEGRGNCETAYTWRDAMILT